MQKVVMPRLDPGMQSGKIIEWLKREGDRVDKDEPVVRVEGEKTTFEVNSPDAGVVRKLLFEPGTDVQVGEAMALVGEPNEPITYEAAEKEKPAVAAVAQAPQQIVTPSRLQEAPASPVARKMAREAGIDLSKVKGSGPGGRIVREDVLKAVEELKKPAGPSAAPVQMRTATVSKTVRLSGKRKATAERLSYSARTTVPATISMDVSMEAALRHKENLTKTTGKAISVTAYAVKASAKALQDYPIVNSSLEGDEVKIYSDVNVAVAIHAPDGLVAPVIPNADKKSIAEITKQIRDLTERATQNALSVSDVTGGTFTVSNLGGYGVDIFAPVMNPPQSAILGLGRTSERAAIVDKQVRVVPITTISLVFDHRIVDGVPAAQFLQRIKELLEAPEKLD